MGKTLRGGCHCEPVEYGAEAVEGRAARRAKVWMPVDVREPRDIEARPT